MRRRRWEKVSGAWISQKIRTEKFGSSIWRRQQILTIFLSVNFQGLTIRRGYDRLYRMRRLLIAFIVLISLSCHAEYASAPPPRKIVPPKLSFSRPWLGQPSWSGDHR